MTAAHHDKSGPKYSRHVPNSMSYDGAREVARKIHDYWRSRGGVVIIHITAMRETDNAGSPHDYQVRSNMVGGLPCPNP